MKELVLGYSIPATPEKFEERVRSLFGRVKEWSKRTGILENSNLEKQLAYYGAEFGELCEAHLKRRMMEVVDGIGDSFVTLINSMFFMVKEEAHDKFVDMFIESTVPFIYGENQEDFLALIEELEFDSSLVGQLSIDPTHPESVDDAMFGLILLETSLYKEYKRETAILGCLEYALDIIEKREGEIVNNVFVKKN